MIFPSKKVMPRYMLFASIFLLIGVAVVVKVGFLMTAQRGFWTEVDKRFLREGDTIPATRGNILAANGEVLAASIPEYELYMDFMSYEKDSTRRNREQFTRDSTLLASLDSICEGMATIIPGTTAEGFREWILLGRARASHHWKLYNRRVSHVQYSALKQLPIFRKSVGAGGFTAERFFKRKNPYGRLGLHTIGELYGGMDKPRSGLEEHFDSILRGIPGLAHRQRVFNTYATIVDKPATDGCDLHTTMDLNMQDIVEEALRDKLVTMDEANYGICILMEVATGDVKAMATLSRAKDGKFYYMDHLALSQLMEPGSVFKPMSFLVAFDDGTLHLNDIVNAHGGQYNMYGSWIKDSGWRNGGPGQIPAIEAIERSSNVAIGTAIDRIYHSRPWDFVKGLERIGVTEDLKLPFKEYKPPRIRMPKKDLSNWSKTALAWMSFGYETQIPPITTVTFYNGVANGGRMVKPRFVTHISRGDQTVQEFPVEVIRERMAKPEAISDIQKCLSAVVKGKHATAKLVRTPQFEISGKTGTAQVWTKGGFKNQYLVSFVGYFPSDTPQYSMIVCVQSGGSVYGGSTCGPVFKRIAETVMSQRRTGDLTSATDSLFAHAPLICSGNVNTAGRVIRKLGLSLPAPVDENATPVWGTFTGNGANLAFQTDTLANDGKMPDVTGYGLRDAIFRLESLGLRVKVKGVGHVGRQSIRAGNTISRGDTVYIYLGNVKERQEIADSLQTEDSDNQEEKVEQPADNAATATTKAKLGSQKAIAPPQRIPQSKPTVTTPTKKKSTPKPTPAKAQPIKGTTPTKPKAATPKPKVKATSPKKSATTATQPKKK